MLTLNRCRSKWRGVVPLFVGLAGSLCLYGCRPPSVSPLVIFLDGAGHFTAGPSVRSGMERGGYIGSFDNFYWSSFLGPGADHLVVARSQLKARQLADKSRQVRGDFPKGKIYVMGLSAGTALIVTALEDLPPGVCVDGVVLFSSSVSGQRDLSRALRHVNGRLYATCSPHDGILSNLPVNADGGSGPPAGLNGFTVPVTLRQEDRAQYAKVINLPWQPSYAGYGWRGGHVDATNSKFIQHVIAPRVLATEPYPLDRPILAVAMNRTVTRPHSVGSARGDE